MTDAQKSALDAEVKKRDLDRKIEDLEKQLSALAPARVEQTEVKVFVVAGAPLDADLTVRYQVRNAAWVPRYDARLATGSKTAPPQLDLTRRAEIKQRTGESWDNVALQLSTARPTADAAAPALQDGDGRFRAGGKARSHGAAPPPPPEDGVARTASGRAQASRSAGEMAAVRRRRPSLRSTSPSRAQPSTTAPFQAVFTVPGRLTFPTPARPSACSCRRTASSPCSPCARCPRSMPRPISTPSSILPKGSPLLPGAVSLFRDGTFVGTGELPVLSPGEEHELGFGVDDQVRVRHAIADEKRGETGLISSARTDSRNFRITVKNMHERAVELVVHDQIPVSQNQDIKVELVGPTAPTTQGHRRQARRHRLRIQARAGGGARDRVRLQGHLAGRARPSSTAEPCADRPPGLAQRGGSAFSNLRYNAHVTFMAPAAVPGPSCETG